MSNVIVKDNETLDSALRRFKRNCAKAGIQQEIRKREHYEKPSVRRKKKSEAARKRKYNQSVEKHQKALSQKTKGFFSTIYMMGKNGYLGGRVLLETDISENIAQRNRLFLEMKQLKYLVMDQNKKIKQNKK